MEDPQPSVKKIALNYGLLWGIASIGIGVVTYVTNTHMERPWWASVLGIVIMVLAVAFGQQAFKKENAGYMSLGEALKVGMAVTAIAAVIGAIWMYIFVTTIDTEFIAKTIEATEINMATQQPDMTPEQKEAAMTMARRFTQPWIIATIGMLLTMFFGFIVSLISGLVLKNQNPMG